jgi:hypothetical protein
MMRDRSATARLVRANTKRQVESAQLRKVDLGATDTWRWLLASFREALDAEQLDGHTAYLSTNLTRHIARRSEALAHAIGCGAPRLVGERRRLLERLVAVAEMATRVDDAVINALSIGGELGDLERAVLCRMLDTIDAELTRTREQDIDMTMRQHWVDVGGCG